MSSEFDQENLISIFVTEASDGMKALASALMPDDGGLPTPRHLHDQFIIAHRIKGAAALYGYDGVAHLCERLETLCECATAISEDRWPAVVSAMREMVQGIQDVVGAIGNGRGEDLSQVERCLAASSDLCLDEPDSMDSMPAAPMTDQEYVSPTLDDAFLSYFVQEAEEYLSVIEGVMPSLRSNSTHEGSLHLLSLTLHALTVAASTIEFHVVGDIARKMEACVSAVYAKRIPLGETWLDAFTSAVSSIRMLMRQDVAALGRLRSEVPVLIKTLDQFCNGDVTSERAFSAAPTSTLNDLDDVMTENPTAWVSHVGDHLSSEGGSTGEQAVAETPGQAGVDELSTAPWLRAPDEEPVVAEDPAPTPISDETPVIEILGTGEYGQREALDSVGFGETPPNLPSSTTADVTASVIGTAYLLPVLDESALSHFLLDAEEFLIELEGLIQILCLDATGEGIQYFMQTTHHLKDTAEAVGFQVVGDIAQGMEVCFTAVLEQRIPLNNEVLDAAVHAISLIRIILQRDATSVETLHADVPGLMDIFCRLSGRPVCGEVSLPVAETSTSLRETDGVGVHTGADSGTGDSSCAEMDSMGRPAGGEMADQAGEEETLTPPWLHTLDEERVIAEDPASMPILDEASGIESIDPEEPVGTEMPDQAGVGETLTTPWLRAPEEGQTGADLTESVGDSPASAGSHDCEAVEECGAGSLRSVGEVSPKAPQGPRLSSRGAPHVPSYAEMDSMGEPSDAEMPEPVGVGGVSLEPAVSFLDEDATTVEYPEAAAGSSVSLLMERDSTGAAVSEEVSSSAIPVDAISETPTRTVSEENPPIVSSEYVLPMIDEEVLSYFVPEAEEYLAVIEEFVPALRAVPTDEDATHRLFRATHTLKGSAYTVDFQVIGDIAHPMEDCMIAIREGRIAVTNELLDAFVYAAALIRIVLKRDSSVVDQLQENIPVLIVILRRLCEGRVGMEIPAPMSVPDSLSGGRDAPPSLEITGRVVPDGEAPSSQSNDYFLPELDPEVLSYFVPEAEEYLETLEADLLRLDKEPQNRELINQLFRTAHTLKGSAYTVGFQAIGDLIHHVEDFMGAVRDHRLYVLAGHTDLILRAVDVVNILMRRDPRVLENTRKRFQAALSELKQLEQGHPIDAQISQDSGETVRQGERMPNLEEDEGRAVKQAEGRTGEERDVIRVSCARLERLMNLVGELVIGRGRLEQRLRMLEQLSDQVLDCKTRMIDSIQSFSEKHTFTFQSAPSSPETIPVPQGTHGFGDFGGLELDKYDDFNILARRIGEVSADITEAMAQLSGSIGRAHEDMNALQQLTRIMRDEIGRARMVPIGTPFTRFRRAIRETARALDKQVSLVTSGEHTEVDTGVVEGLVDPLVHLVRNAVYHGIEPPGERVAKGKPPAGTIYLHAAHRGNSVVIEVEDDGAGLNLAKVREKAVAVGFARREQVQALSDDDVRQFIFAPGFSTAEKVGDQAGRGVGLDVVMRAIKDMNGHIEVESAPGVGTKFTLSLPLTLLITTALLVRVGQEHYAFALSNIREVTVPTAMVLEHIGDRTLLRMEEEVIEVQSLRQILYREPNPVSAGMPIVIVRTSVGLLGLAVDELLGRQEIVIKTLGSLKPLVQSSFAGATIDPEGRVILVVDPSRLEMRQTMRSSSSPTPVSTLMSPVDSETGPLGDTNAVILLIDDSLSIRKFVGRMLKSAGYPVDTAVDGDDGIKKASEKSYRLVITDLEMPKFNGYEVVQALRVRPQTRHTPIVVMTTRAGDKHRQLAFDIGANSYIAKPVDERALIDEVERWVGTIPAGGM